MRITKDGQALGSIHIEKLPKGSQAAKDAKAAQKEIEELAKERREAPEKTREQWQEQLQGSAEAGPEQQDAPEPEESVDEGPPAHSAPKSEWVDYCVSQGYEREECESLTKADLVEQFGE